MRAAAVARRPPPAAAPSRSLARAAVASPSPLPLALTDRSPLRVASSTSQKPAVVVQHSQLVADPYGAVRKLHADLVAAGAADLTVPTETQVTRLIRPSAEKPRA